MVLRLLIVLVLLLPVACTPVADVKKDASVHETLGFSYLQEGNPTKALKEFLLAVEDDPENPDIRSGLAQAYHRKKAYELAEEQYLKALEYSHGDPKIRNNLGALYLDMQRWEDALRHFRLAADNLLFGSPEVARTGMAVAQIKLGKYIDAVESCQRALQINPQYPQARLYLGEAYDALDKPDLAIVEYRKAVVFVPNYLEAHYRLGMSYMRQKKMKEARDEFSRVIDIAPESDRGRLASQYLKLLK